MSEVRTLLGSLLVGVSGAVVIAALVLGRGDAALELKWERLEEDGGVLWVHIENYERPPFKRVSSLLPERTITDSWRRAEPGSERQWITAWHTLDGELIVSNPSSPRMMMVGESRRGAVIAWPEPRGDSVAKGDGSCDEISDDMERRPTESDGSFVCTVPYPRPPSGSGSSAGQPAWPIDLDVVSVRKEARFSPSGGLESVRFVASLEDGSEVLIASERYHVSILPLRDWDYIEELVFGD